MGAVYTQLTITERRRIERWRHVRVLVDEVARVLKRCRSMIFRELKRNFFSEESMPKCDGYYGDAAHRMIHEDAPIRVCQETIYRHIYSKEGLRDELWWYLPTHRVARRPCRARKKHPPKFHRDVSVLFRPDDVAHWRELGHWEGDLMLFELKLGQNNVTLLVERMSHFTMILKNPNKRTEPEMGKIIKAIKDLPHLARRLITLDQ